MLADEEKQCFLGGNDLKYYAIFRERGELQRIGFLIFKKFFLLLVSAMHWLKMTRRKFFISLFCDGDSDSSELAGSLSPKPHGDSVIFQLCHGNCK